MTYALSVLFENKMKVNREIFDIDWHLRELKEGDFYYDFYIGRKSQCQIFLRQLEDAIEILNRVSVAAISKDDIKIMLDGINIYHPKD